MVQIHCYYFVYCYDGNYLVDRIYLFRFHCILYFIVAKIKMDYYENMISFYCLHTDMAVLIKQGESYIT